MTFLLITFFFFFNDTATTEIYTLSLHDALPIFFLAIGHRAHLVGQAPFGDHVARHLGDRKSTRLNSSHANISYAVFCLKKKKLFSIAYPLTLNRILLHSKYKTAPQHFAHHPDGH